MSNIEIGLTVNESAIAFSAGSLAALATFPLGLSGLPLTVPLFGLGAAIGWIAGRSVKWITEAAFNTDNPLVLKISKIIQLAITFFATVGCMVGCVSVMVGFPVFAFKMACVLTLTTFGIRHIYVNFLKAISPRGLGTILE